MGTHQIDEAFIVKLERRFTNIDSALIRAIVSDYESNTNPEEIILQLERISIDAVADDDGSFDPSGTQGQQRSKQSRSSAQSPIDSSQSGSSETGTGTASDLLTLATALSINDGRPDSGVSDIGSLRYFDELTEAQKITKLGEMFPRMKQYDYEHALKKAKGSFVVAVDSLLTHFLLLNEEKSESDDHVPLKGVDGFGEEFTTVTKKRRRGRKNKAPKDVDSPVILPKYALLNIPKDEDVTPTHRVRSPHLGLYAAAANQEFAKAAQYYKQSKSNPLMGGAAAYHSSLAREQLEIAKSRVSAEADTVVARQCSASHVDLHGINSEDGKRIALEYVRRWWDGLGEGRIKTGGKSRIGKGFEVVVGRGVHSAGGRGVLGPSVARALFTAGWKVEVGSGVLIVKGRQ